MAVDYKAGAEALIWKQNFTHERNFAKSIGTTIGSDTKHPVITIDLENAVFYNPHVNERPMSFVGESSGDGNARLNVEGSLSANSFTIGNATLQMDYSSGEKIKMVHGGKKLDITPTEENGVVATESKLNKIKESVELDKNKLAAFLEIIKFAPGLEDKRTEIENIVDSLNQGE